MNSGSTRKKRVQVKTSTASAAKMTINGYTFPVKNVRIGPLKKRIYCVTTWDIVYAKAMIKKHLPVEYVLLTVADDDLVWSVVPRVSSQTWSDNTISEIHAVFLFPRYIRQVDYMVTWGIPRDRIYLVKDY